MKARQVQMNYKVGDDVKAWVIEQAAKLDDRKPGWFLDNLIRQHMKKDKPAKKKESSMPAVSNQWQMPAGLNAKAWGEFEQHRKDIKKPMTDTARTKAANQICGLSHEQQQATIDKSIQSRWAGLFPEKLKNTKSFIEQQNDATFDSLFGEDQQAIEGECHVRD